MRQNRFLIIGQGLAGTAMAQRLLSAGQSVHVIDPGLPETSSKVAAGIINPITGRQYVKSWRFDELLPAFLEYYREMRELLGLVFLQQRPVLRAFLQSREADAWQEAARDPGRAAYIRGLAGGAGFEQIIQPVHAFGEVGHSYQLDTGALLAAYRTYLLDRQMLTAETFRPDLLEITGSGIRYRGIESDYIVFCEGIGLKENPWFNYLPLPGSKGEVLILRIKGHNPDALLKHKLFLVPLGQDLFWVGGTYQNQYSDALPAQATRAELLQKLSEILDVAFEPVQHRAAIRPTVRDRRPLLGRHPQFPHLIVFNGMGTKGASLAPFWSAALVRHLLRDEALDPEVDIRRFQHFIQSP